MESRGDFISSPDLCCSDASGAPRGAFNGLPIQPVALRRSPRGRPRTPVGQPLCLARLLHRYQSPSISGVTGKAVADRELAEAEKAGRLAPKVSMVRSSGTGREGCIDKVMS